jgi:hypothetical protein
MTGIKMRAQEFINEEKIGTSAKRPGRKSDRPARQHTAEPRYKTKSADVNETQLDERGKATVKLCKSSRPDKDLGASNLASCKSQGLRARDGNKSHKLGKSTKSRVKVDGKKIKGAKYGGPLPDWSE